MDQSGVVVRLPHDHTGHPNQQFNIECLRFENELRTRSMTELTPLRTIYNEIAIRKQQNATQDDRAAEGRLPPSAATASACRGLVATLRRPTTKLRMVFARFCSSPRQYGYRERKRENDGYITLIRSKLESCPMAD
ncbi:hypothetical protein V9T40_013154 [Parthenolecanium corni]|uniref:Uncharacterized protein n=1 Tax=Parthenolecanium corni TaxID=536013 RepID=A0AAN9TWR1_9HEMI